MAILRTRPLQAASSESSPAGRRPVPAALVGLSVVAVLVAALPLELAANDAAFRSREYQIKAAYISKFPSYVRWPHHDSGSASPLVLGILGNDPFGDALRILDDGSGAWLIRRLADARELRSCHVAFISDSEKEGLSQILTSLEGKGVLTVSDLKNFSRNGGIVELKVSKNRVRFEINLTAARAAGLEISAELLKLADVVHHQ